MRERYEALKQSMNEEIQVLQLKLTEAEKAGRETKDLRTQLEERLKEVSSLGEAAEEKQRALERFESLTTRMLDAARPHVLWFLDERFTELNDIVPEHKEVGNNILSWLEGSENYFRSAVEDIAQLDRKIISEVSRRTTIPRRILEELKFAGRAIDARPQEMIRDDLIMSVFLRIRDKSRPIK
jgi:hypothetical protein